MGVEMEVLAAGLRALEQLGQRGNRAHEGAEIAHPIAAVADIDQPRVVDDPDARLPVAERDDPDPVAKAHVVVGAEAPRAEPAARQRAVAPRGEVVDVAHVLPAAPHRRRRVLLVAVDEA
jgi:hypothetical protein